MFAGIEVHWIWFAAGALLLLLEVVVPGAVLMWFGFAAIITGALTAVADIGFDWQVLIFSLLSVGSAGGYWLWKRPRQPEPPPEPMINRAGAELIGKVLTLASPIVDGHGRAKVGDSSWRVDGPDLPAGARVKVVAVESGTLLVEPAED